MRYSLPAWATLFTQRCGGCFTVYWLRGCVSLAGLLSDKCHSNTPQGNDHLRRMWQRGALDDRDFHDSKMSLSYSVLSLIIYHFTPGSNINAQQVSFRTGKNLLTLSEGAPRQYDNSFCVKSSWTIWKWSTILNVKTKQQILIQDTITIWWLQHTVEWFCFQVCYK